MDGISTSNSAIARHGVMIEAWSPLGRGTVLQDSVIAAIARTSGRSVAQVVLRWHIQHGMQFFPSPTTRSECGKTSTSSISRSRREKWPVSMHSTGARRAASVRTRIPSPGSHRTHYLGLLPYMQSPANDRLLMLRPRIFFGGHGRDGSTLTLEFTSSALPFTPQ